MFLILARPSNHTSRFFFLLSTPFRPASPAFGQTSEDSFCLSLSLFSVLTLFLTLSSLSPSDRSPPYSSSVIHGFAMSLFC
ncbi:hypothetical protein BDV19DRAFT_180792 [Aspergillus venezuelensis]